MQSVDSGQTSRNLLLLLLQTKTATCPQTLEAMRLHALTKLIYMFRARLNTRQIAFRLLAWTVCLGLITLMYWISLAVNGSAVGIPRSWAIAGWLAIGHTPLLILTYYWVTRALYPAIVQQRWYSVSWQLLGIYPINALWTYYLYVLVGSISLGSDKYSGWHQTQLKQADAFASLTGISILVPNWWLYSILVTAVALKISRDVYLAKTGALQLEMNLLRAQINPHFLFNTLNNIYSLIEEKDAYAAELLLKFGDIMRYTLYENNAHFIALQQEITMIKTYIELEQLRYDPLLPPTIRLDEAGVYTDAVVPPLLLLTLVENAFKHGTQSRIKSAWVDIMLCVDNEQIQCQVSNSKPAATPLRAGGRHKINVHRVGLTNIRRRLQLLYPDRHTLAIVDQLDTYTVRLLIPTYATTPFLSGH